MRKRSRAGGYLIVVAVVLGLGLIGTFVLGRTYGELALQREPFHRLSYVPSFDPVEDVTLGLSPNAGNVYASAPDPAIRAIVVYPTQTILLAGGKAVRSINRRAPATLHALVKAVASRRWISESRGTVTLDAAVILSRGSSMRIAAPVTSNLVMTVRPGVFLAASQQARLALSGVDVRASDAKVPDTFTIPAHDLGRPFVLAAQNSTMTISDSTFSYLGRDWNSSYGLSWSKGSTGSVTNSIFKRDFIGVYSNDAHGLRILHNQFYHNSLYGVDPHSGSSHLLIEYNTASFNGRHGIIFSDHVTHGIVQYNLTEGNGLNGIMMDEASSNNTIAHNTVIGNRSDGIVLANSSGNVIADNAISRNRVGITLRGSIRDTKVFGNRVSNNQLAAQGIELSENKVSNNGGQWSGRRLSSVWLATLALLPLLLFVTWLIKPHRGSHR
jgi:poly(beta-D-mannuronate) C5 epimerase